MLRVPDLLTGGFQVDAKARVGLSHVTRKGELIRRVLKTEGSIPCNVFMEAALLIFALALLGLWDKSPMQITISIHPCCHCP